MQLVAPKCNEGGGSGVIWLLRLPAYLLSKVWHDVRSWWYQFLKNKNSFSEDLTPFVATNQHWKSFQPPMLELVSFCSGAINRFDTPFTVKSITAPGNSESRGRKFKSTWTRCTSSIVLTCGGEIPCVAFNADKKLNERSCTRYIRRSIPPNVGLDTCPKISELSASRGSKITPSRSFFHNVIRAFRPDSRLVNSTSMFVPMTANHAVAVTSETGQFLTSFLTMLLLVSMICISSVSALNRSSAADFSSIATFRSDFIASPISAASPITRQKPKNILSLSINDFSSPKSQIISQATDEKTTTIPQCSRQNNFADSESENTMTTDRIKADNTAIRFLNWAIPILLIVAIINFFTSRK